MNNSTERIAIVVAFLAAIIMPSLVFASEIGTALAGLVK